MVGNDHCYFFGCSGDCRCGRYRTHDHRSQDKRSSVGAARKVSPNWSQETMTCHSFNCFSIVLVRVGHPDVLTAINNDVKLDETRTVNFASSFRFEKINKLDRFTP